MRMPSPDSIDLLSPFLVPPSDARHRLFHGRGKTLPGWEGLTLDRFPPVLVATLFDDYPPATLAALEQRLGEALPGLGCDTLVFQHRHRRPAVTEVRRGALPETAWAEEGGLRYRLDFQRGQNLGFFADMAPGRAWLRERAEGKRVLNLFSFTCAFSVAALAGGAHSVVNIDLSRPALALGRENQNANGFADARVHYLPHNVFRSWKKLHALGRYDLIVADPPSAQKGSFLVERDYPKVLARLSKLLAPEAELLLCLNAPWLPADWLREQAAERLPGATFEGRLPGAAGFDEAAEPALKALAYRYRRPAP
jgi:23S rRNA (cytosine1962-C5)-methyltransferase|tara:strand:- start:36804 stop:37733 length:930 start_codon:yes stop_codon:yes gene_type:complete